MPRISHHTLLLPFHPATFEFPANHRFPNPDTGWPFRSSPAFYLWVPPHRRYSTAHSPPYPQFAPPPTIASANRIPLPKRKAPIYSIYRLPIPTTLSLSPFSGSQVHYISISTPTRAEQYPTSIHFDFIYLFLRFYTYGITPVIAQCQR
jgi:hypothetical protein